MSTKCSNRDDAVSVANQSGLKQAELAARAGKLTAEAISKILTGQRITLQGAMDAWLDRLSCRGRSPRTVHNYKLFVQSFVNEHSEMMPSSVTEDHINDWLNDSALTQKAGSRMVKLTAMRSFMEYCGDKGWCVGNPANLVEVNYSLMTHEQKEPKQRIPFTDEEVDALLHHTHQEGLEFWHAAILIGRYIGLRLGDIAGLEWACFEKPGKIIVWTDKHDRRVELPVEPERLSIEISTISRDDEAYLFPTQREMAESLERRAVLSTQFSRLCVTVGIAGKSFHCLRHAFSTDCFKRGQPIWYIARSLGHSRESTTAGYIH